jgi:peptidoglycan hydrolase-like protein with peptidoglycan-binding domain
VASTPTSGNGPIVGSLGGHRQNVSNLLAVSTSTSLTSPQDQIASLTLQLNSLLAQRNITTGNTQNNFTRNLSLHATGADVKLLQQFLNTHGFVITTSGAGSFGNETTLFGTLTYKALMKYQKSVGLPATGFFGPMTRAYIANH